MVPMVPILFLRADTPTSARLLKNNLLPRLVLPEGASAVP
jgi:hypothetical protein